MTLTRLQGWSLQADALTNTDRNKMTNDPPPTTITTTTNIISIQECHTEIVSGHSRSLDLASPREWLEYWEDHYHCSGCYTVLRCDYNLLAGRKFPKTIAAAAAAGSAAATNWRIWGRNFHLQRLRESYLCLLQEDIHIVNQEHSLEEWKQSANKLIDTLLSQAEAELSNRYLESEHQDLPPDSIIVFMVTLLWQPAQQIKMGDVGSIKQQQQQQQQQQSPVETLAKGHICSSLSVQSTNQYPKPMRAALALPSGKSSKLGGWPNRIDFHPTAKLSSWCRQRRPLEEALKLPNIDEVILLKESQGESSEKVETFEMLEGLTTNLFFVFPGRILRTAPGKTVLQGYARHLVLKHAEKCGLIVDASKAVTLEDLKECQEVFATSSIRIIVPVKELLFPVYQKDQDDTPVELQSLWSSSSCSEPESRPYWQRLLDSIMVS